MSLQEIDNRIRKLQLEDPYMQTGGNCRYAAEKMKLVALEADRSAPHVEIEYLVYPQAFSGTRVHYALKAGEYVFNPVRAAGFPLYFGPIDSAPGLLPLMKPTEKIL